MFVSSLSLYNTNDLRCLSFYAKSRNCSFIVFRKCAFTNSGKTNCYIILYSLLLTNATFFGEIPNETKVPCQFVKVHLCKFCFFISHPLFLLSHKIHSWSIRFRVFIAKVKWFFRNFTFFILTKYQESRQILGFYILRNSKIRFFAEEPLPLQKTIQSREEELYTGSCDCLKVFYRLSSPFNPCIRVSAIQIS